MELSKLELTRNYPLPQMRVKNVYPYKEMVVGDSFLVPNAKLQIVCNNNWRVGKKLNMVFSARKEGEGVRVWRVV
jgi:hypothetical protein